MKNVASFLFISFLCLSILHAQQEKDSIIQNTDSYFTFSPAALAHFAPRWRVGYIQHLKSNLKFGVSAGYGHKTINLNFSNRERVNYELWEVRPEIYFIVNAAAKTFKYFSFEYFYINHENTFVNNRYENKDGQTFEYAQADYIRIKHGLHLNYGFFLNVGKHLGFNFSVGIGFRFLNKDYLKKINSRPVRGFFFEGIADPYFKEVSNFKFHPSLALKIYLRQ